MSPKTPAIPATTSVPPPGKKLRSAQFDYAWKWFDYHADQRTKVFNYMVLAMSLFANAVVASIDKKLWPVAIALCLVSGIVAVLFRQLDFRNETLVHRGERVLKLREDQLFADEKQKADAQPKDHGCYHGYGILRQEPEPGDLTLRRAWQDFMAGKHRFCFRAIAWIMAGLFFVGGIAIFLAHNRVVIAVIPKR